MIKVETLGMLDVAKINPVLKSTNEVENYSFLTDSGIVYLISNTIVGDDAYKENVKIPAGNYLNGYDLKAWEGQKLVIDKKHITFADGENYAGITAGTTKLIVSNGKLAITSTTPTSGIYFLVTDKVKLTEAAVKAKICVVDVDTPPVSNDAE